MGHLINSVSLQISMIELAAEKFSNVNLKPFAIHAVRPSHMSPSSAPAGPYNMAVKILPASK